MSDVLVPNPPGLVRGRPFEKGRSGNPTGRRFGSRNKATLAAATLLAGESEALTRTAVELALAGDPTAMRLCLERILPRVQRISQGQLYLAFGTGERQPFGIFGRSQQRDHRDVLRFTGGVAFQVMSSCDNSHIL